MEEPNFNQGATPPNSEPVKKSSDWKVVLVIVFIAFLSTVAYGVYYFFTNQDVAQVPMATNTPTATPPSSTIAPTVRPEIIGSPSPIPIGYWAIYQTNEVKYSPYNIFVKYPSDYLIKQNKGDWIQFIDEKYTGIEGENSNIILRVRNTSPDTNLATWFDDNSRLYIGDLKWSDVPHSEPVALEVGGKQAVQTTYEGMGEVGVTVIKNGSYILEIKAHTLSSLKLDPEFLGVYNYILSNVGFK